MVEQKRPNNRSERRACQGGSLRPAGVTPVVRSDNGIVERFFRTLKEECAWQHSFQPSRMGRERSESGLIGITSVEHINRWVIRAPENTRALQLLSVA